MIFLVDLRAGLKLELHRDVRDAKLIRKFFSNTGEDLPPGINFRLGDEMHGQR